MKHPQLENREQLGLWLNDLGLVNEGAEIGVAYGGFSRIILDKWTGRTLHMVDLWEQQPDTDYLEQTNRDNQFELWHEQAKGVARFYKRAILHKGYSHEVSREFPDKFLDFAYIDANHAYVWVRRDIKAWWPKIKSGGVLLGHDYYDDINPPHHCEVKWAVDDWTKEMNLKLNLTSEEFPSWYVFKP